MKTLILFEDSRTQLVLKPETAHDRMVCKTLAGIANSYRVNFDRARGGWTQDFYEPPPAWKRDADEYMDLAIVFDHTPLPSPPEQG